jgi:gamma-glutamyl-gamma-aminobutyrate hydrolase PuuD
MPATLAGADALLLTGGTDIDPRLFGEEAHAETDPPDRIRDNNEMGVLTEALARNVPVLAICRGVQLLNVHQGGTLIQHLASVRHDPEPADRGTVAHVVAVQPDTLLSDAVAEVSIGVNSRHHQAIARPGQSLRVCALDLDENVIESVDYPGKRWVLGVQWHPEDQVDSAAALRLFEAFARAVELS